MRVCWARRMGFVNASIVKMTWPPLLKPLEVRWRWESRRRECRVSSGHSQHKYSIPDRTAKSCLWVFLDLKLVSAEVRELRIFLYQVRYTDEAAWERWDVWPIGELKSRFGSQQLHRSCYLTLYLSTTSKRHSFNVMRVSFEIILISGIGVKALIPKIFLTVVLFLLKDFSRKVVIAGREGWEAARAVVVVRVSDWDCLGKKSLGCSYQYLSRECWVDGLCFQFRQMGCLKRPRAQILYELCTKTKVVEVGFLGWTFLTLTCFWARFMTGLTDSAVSVTLAV